MGNRVGEGIGKNFGGWSSGDLKGQMRDGGGGIDYLLSNSRNGRYSGFLE